MISLSGEAWQDSESFTRDSFALQVFRFTSREMTSAAIHHGPAVLQAASLVMAASARLNLGGERMSSYEC